MESAMTMYMDDLRSLNRGRLLTRDEERAAARRTEAGVLAAWILDGNDPGKAISRQGSAFTREDLVADVMGRIRPGEQSPAVDVLAADPSSPEGRAFLSRACEEGEKARTELIECNLRLVIRLASAMTDQAPMEDRVQNGGIGLCHGVLKYDWRTGNKVSTYIYHWILQAMSREGCNTGRIIRIPVHMDARMRKIRAAEDAGRPDGMTAERRSEAEACERLLHVASLDRPLTGSDGSATLGDVIGAADEGDLDEGFDREILSRLVRRAAGPVLRTGCGRISAMLHGFGRPRKTHPEVSMITGMGRKAIRRADAQGMRHLAAALSPLAVGSGEYTREEAKAACGRTAV